eukprot:CAMPEP_0116893678 /NCGR_PEP_ID=MMETSP0467-20121206/3616_1 /TAXON_ID=283647 /ORGANISM="Mesodinium pulex, Strain SPMC105" /LENGTH=68 /DNA_ID=CAMNT_0004563477 /DNA_START=508 /DNA_END=714 /DNA_ORIENTATION=-
MYKTDPVKVSSADQKALDAIIYYEDLIDKYQLEIEELKAHDAHPNENKTKIKSQSVPTFDKPDMKDSN